MMLDILEGRVLLADGTLRREALHIEDGIISGIGDGAGSRAASGRWDARGLLILPGIVDIHGDAFERQLMPRPSVFFSHALAFLETDRQMVSNGITTAYHGLTYSWEPGLRGAEAARAFVEALEKEKPRLACDTRLHLRFETHNIEAADEIARWIREGRVDLLAFNDHTECFWNELDIPRYSTVFESRSGLANDAYRVLLEEVRSRRGRVPEAVEALAAAAVEHGIPMASHDDETPEMRRRYHELGCRICEFPTTSETALFAREIGDPVVLGAPNVVRGRSHGLKRPCARKSIAEGLCTVLSSDYYYPALLQSAFSLALHGILPIEEGWRLVSANPAVSVGLTDRGAIAPGMRADLIFVDDADPTLPRVTAVLVAGRPVFASGEGLRFCQGVAVKDR